MVVYSPRICCFLAQKPVIKLKWVTKTKLDADTLGQHLLCSKQSNHPNLLSPNIGTDFLANLEKSKTLTQNWSRSHINPNSWNCLGTH